MPGQLGRFQMVGFQGWSSTVTKQNHLGQIFQLQPQKATNLMVQLLALHRGKTYETFLSKYPTKEFEDDSEYTWDIIGSSRRNIPLVEARTADGTVVTKDMTVGAGFEPFYLVFPEDWFGHGEILWGSLNEQYPVRVLSDNARFEGTNAVYKVECFGSNSKGIPGSLLLAGERFSPAYAAVENDFSRKAGAVRYASPASMRNEWTTIRIYKKVGGNMLNRKLAVGIPVTKDTAGLKMEKTVMNMWMHYEDWAVEQQFSEYKNNAILWGVSTRNNNGEYYNFGDSGEPIKTGDGLFKQMERGNTMYYNTTDGVMKMLLDALYELSAAKLTYGERRFVVCTGERGALIFNREAKKMTSGWMPLMSTQNPAYFNKKATNYAAQNGLSVTDYQVTEWKAPNGVIVELQVDPMYDDPVRNKVLHPEGGVAFSYRFDIFDMGTMDQPNIFKCAIKGQTEFRGYRWGLRNPWTGQMGNSFMSFDEDSAEFHRMAKFGVCVLDPTRTLSLIPSILQ